jgi:hypothetical protein
MYAVLLGAAPVRNTMRLLAIYYPTTRVVANVVGRRRVPMMMREKMTMATTTRQRGAVNDAMHTRVPRQEDGGGGGRKEVLHTKGIPPFPPKKRVRHRGHVEPWNKRSGRSYHGENKNLDIKNFYLTAPSIGTNR